MIKIGKDSIITIRLISFIVFAATLLATFPRSKSLRTSGLSSGLPTLSGQVGLKTTGGLRKGRYETFRKLPFDGMFPCQTTLNKPSLKVNAAEAGAGAGAGTTRKKMADPGENEGTGLGKIFGGLNTRMETAAEQMGEGFSDFLAGMSPRVCSTSMDCRREHALDERVGYECCSYGPINMCCFPRDDDDDWHGGFGRPLLPEYQLVPIPIPVDPQPGAGLDGYPPYRR
mmetsp:Transcript_16692/g.25107  ORF Transcript_16692/g.25107 Transcript_16692/m.25107 type:complete len:228 (-) Transcript_16692:6-689(-)